MTVTLMELSIYAVSLGVLVALWLIYGIGTGTWNPVYVFLGNDGRPSTSKFQWFLWTVVILFSMSAISAARVMRGAPEPISTLPVNLLVVLGLSGITMVTAKGITTLYVRSGRLKKPSTSFKSMSALFLDDENAPDLGKIQMMGVLPGSK
jgi:hypothetical protein